VQPIHTLAGIDTSPQSVWFVSLPRSAMKTAPDAYVIAPEVASRFMGKNLSLLTPTP
jgi:hypothetical protein